MNNTKMAAAAVVACFLWTALSNQLPAAPPDGRTNELALPSLEIGVRGGRLLFAQRSEPKTLNPVIAIDLSSRQILELLNADLIHINGATQRTEPALARTWTVSADKREYTLTLRRGLRFSDGQPFTVDDVMFTFQVYLDEKMHSPQRDMLVVAGKPLQVRKTGPDTVRFSLDAPYAAAERMFDSVFILPKHLLEKSYKAGEAANAWPLTVAAREIAGLGPFRLKQYVPGERLVVERNPYFWKQDAGGNALPYLDEIAAVNTGGAQGEAMRFAAGEIDLVDRLSPGDFVVLGRQANSRRIRLADLGPGLEFDFLFFNLNGGRRSGTSLLPGPEAKAGYDNVAFRRAVSTAIDRQALIRLAYNGKAYPLSTFVPPGDSRWVDKDIPAWQYSKEQARRILRDAGFTWNGEGRLESSAGKTLRFSLVYNASNPQHGEMAALIQQDLEQIGIGMTLVPLEFHSLLDRVFRTFDYEAAIMALAGGDADPNSEINIWSSQGSTHVWDLTHNGPEPPWQEEINRLMQRQMIIPEYPRRKAIYDRVQELVWRNLPITCLISPNILVGAKDNVGNFHPVILGDHILWNADRLYLRRERMGSTSQRR